MKGGGGLQNEKGASQVLPLHKGAGVGKVSTVLKGGGGTQTLRYI